MAATEAVITFTPAHHSADLEMLFKQCFYKGFRTLLIGGADEPLYSPARSSDQLHRLYYRADYFASALHEIAHWCIAGAQRRQQEDWGYWYCPDGRSPAQQRAFEAVEVKPQALEWILSVAAAAPFRISTDNLLAADGPGGGGTDFTRAVSAQVRRYRQTSLPPRAVKFLWALASFYNVADPMAEKHYTGLEL